MTTSSSMASQVSNLLVGLSAHSGQHLTEVETDLVQMNKLLSEAIEKLSASFIAIHDAVAAQQKMVDVLLSSETVLSDTMTDLQVKATQIDLHVNAAITGLQFQDMTNQLISRTIRRVVGFRDVMEMVGRSGGALAPDADNVFLREQLAAMSTSLQYQSVNLEKELWKAVCQTHMESGDVELF